MNPNTLDMSQTLMNNTLNAPWIDQPELKIAWIMADEFIYLVSEQSLDIKQSSLDRLFQNEEILTVHHINFN